MSQELAADAGRRIDGQSTEILTQARAKGGEIVGLLKTGSAYYAPATSAIASAAASPAIEYSSRSPETTIRVL